VNKRFTKLAALTRGATLLTLSSGAVSGAAACTKNEPPSPPVAASQAADPAAVDPGDAALGLMRRRRFPIPNAMHAGWRHHNGGDGGDGEGAADGGTNDGS
jgi:hypothetical protein